MHVASRHGTPRLTSPPKDDEVSCEVGLRGHPSGVRAHSEENCIKPLGHSPRISTFLQNRSTDLVEPAEDLKCEQPSIAQRYGVHIPPKNRSSKV